MRRHAALAAAALASACSQQPAEEPILAAQATPASTAAVQPKDDYRVETVDAAELARRFQHTDAVNAGIKADRLVIRGRILRHGYRDPSVEEISLGTRAAHVSVLARAEEAEAARLLPVGQLLAVSCASATGPADDVTAINCSGFD